MAYDRAMKHIVAPLAPSLALATLVIAAIPTLAQVSARQATPADATQFQSPTVIPSPMLVEVKMPSWVAMVATKWVTRETGRYVCQEVRVPLIEVWKEESRGKVRLRVVAGLLAQDRPKDVDVTVSIVSDSMVIRKRFWDGFTADPISRHPRNPEAEFEFTSQEFAALFGPARAPLVRVVLDVKE